jgi:hypothetical protein
MIRRVVPLLLATALQPASAALIEVFPIRDTTIYSDAQSFSNGAGDYLFAGATNNGTDYLRRALLAFDFSAIPAGSLIVSAELRLTVSRKPLTDSGLRTFTLHRATSDWGEGTSDASGEEGSGIAAASGDATWVNRFQAPAQGWTTAGGDFAATPSASLQMGDPAPYLFNLPGHHRRCPGLGQRRGQSWLGAAGRRNPRRHRPAVQLPQRSGHRPHAHGGISARTGTVRRRVLTGFGLVLLVLRRKFPAA